MLNSREKDKRTKLIDEEIDRATIELSVLNPASDEYYNVSCNVDRLIKSRKELKENRGLSPDTKAMIIANLAGIGLMLIFEKSDIITSKALGYIAKIRF